MHANLLIGKDHGIGMPGKNVRHLLGRPMAEYGFIAAREAGLDRHYVSTDSAALASTYCRKSHPETIR